MPLGSVILKQSAYSSIDFRTPNKDPAENGAVEPVASCETKLPTMLAICKAIPFTWFGSRTRSPAAWCSLTAASIAEIACWTCFWLSSRAKSMGTGIRTSWMMSSSVCSRYRRSHGVAESICPAFRAFSVAFPDAIDRIWLREDRCAGRPLEALMCPARVICVPFEKFLQQRIVAQ